MIEQVIYSKKIEIVAGCGYNNLAHNEKLLYLMKSHDVRLTQIFGKWIIDINRAYKNHRPL